VANSTDCNDSNANVNPGATEACNSVDDDCDGATDEGYLLTVTSIDCKTITVTNPGPLTLSNFSVTVDDVVVGSSGPSSLAPGASGTFRLAYVLDGAQKVKVRSGTSGSCTSANFTFNKECAVRLGFALWPDQGGDDLALVRVIDNQGADFKSRTGLDVVTDRSGRTKCDIGYGVVDIDTADLNAYDLLYYHSHSPFYPSATALNRLYTWVSEGGVLIFDDCGGANYADLTTAFGVYVDFTGSTGGPSYASQWILDSDLYRVPYAYSTTEFSNAATWTEGGQKSMSGGVVEIVRRGSSPFVSGKKIGNGWLAFVGGDWGCSLSCSCNVGTTLGYRLMLNFAYIASGRAKLIR
jgi:hypothetical protein